MPVIPTSSETAAQKVAAKLAITQGIAKVQQLTAPGNHVLAWGAVEQLLDQIQANLRGQVEVKVARACPCGFSHREVYVEPFLRLDHVHAVYCDDCRPEGAVTDDEFTAQVARWYDVSVCEVD